MALGSQNSRGQEGMEQGLEVNHLFLGKHVCQFGPAPLAPTRRGPENRVPQATARPARWRAENSHPSLGTNSTESDKTEFTAFSSKL